MKDDEEFFEDEEAEKVENSSTLASIYYENKKLIWVLIIVIILIFLMLIFGNSSKSNNKVDNKINVSLSSQTETISVNNTKQLKVTVNENNNRINNPDIIWTSSDSSVAIVDSNGNIRGLKEGTATITATYKDKDESYTSTCNVTVISSGGTEGVKLLSIKFKEGTIIMAPNSTYNLYYEKDPFNGMVTSSVYSSTNESVAKVDQDGKVTAMNVGTGTIKLTVNNTIAASINIQVIDRQVTPGIYILPRSLAFKENEYELTVDEGKQLTYNNEPYNANLTFMEFSSNNSKVATVDSRGYVKAISAGDATITISCGGVSANTIVHVKNKVIDVRTVNVLDNNVTLGLSKTHQIKADVNPDDATDKSLKYVSNNTSIVKVDSNGLVTAVGKGSTYVTVSSNSNKNASVNVFFKVDGGSSGGNSGGNSGGSGGSSGGSGGSSGGSSNGVATVKITSNNNAVQVSYENALKESRKNYPTLTITPSGKYTSIKYCTYTYGTSNSCTPNTTYNGPFELRKNGVTVIRARAIYNGKEGDILTRYINVVGNGSSESYKCYCNSNGVCTTSGLSSTYNTSVDVTETYCRAYINRGNVGCFVNNGNYVWGNYLGKSSSYVYIGTVTSEAACKNGGTNPTGSFTVNWGNKYGYNLAIDSVRIFEFNVSSNTNISRIYFCESQSSSKCTIDTKNATKKTRHFDLRVLSGSTYDTSSTYNKTFYFEDISGTSFRFYLVTEKGHSVTLLAADSNNKVSASFSTTAQ